jgi:hypothetical protein
MARNDLIPDRSCLGEPGAARGGAQERKAHSVQGKRRAGAKVLRQARAAHAGAGLGPTTCRLEIKTGNIVPVVPLGSCDLERPERLESRRTVKLSAPIMVLRGDSPVRRGVAGCRWAPVS